VDIFKVPGLRFTAITITGSQEVNWVSADYSIAKWDLVAAFEVPFHKDRHSPRTCVPTGEPARASNCPLPYPVLGL
jgi:hypothetical protein